MTKKTPEELQLEREEAAKQLEQILSASRPKGFVQGVNSGVNNILKGAVGAAGIVVLGPTIGLSIGLRKGGLLGGIVGVTGGAIAGVLGGAAMAVTGAIGGVSQIVRGIINTPESIVAPQQGKWWNEYEGKWVETYLDQLKESIKDIPEDDRDVLGKLQDEIDASLELGAEGTSVKDMFYYDVLEVPGNADQSAIKRKYYLLAREYHPDKAGTDDIEAAEKFKEIAEAYQVLSDPELRKKYDKLGKDGFTADTAAAKYPTLDPAVLFAFLFGSDQFYDYIGRLSMATSASIGDSPKVSLADARALQSRRVTRLALKLATKIDPWVELSKQSLSPYPVEEQWAVEVQELSMASYGHQLVTTIGKIYNLLAIMYEGSIESGQGLPSLSKWAARQNAILLKKREADKNKMDMMKGALTMLQVQVELQQKMEQAKTEEERQVIAKEMEDKASSVLLEILWTVTVVDITSTIHETTMMVFFDLSVDQETRMKRAEAVKALGKIWMDFPEPESVNPDEQDAKKLFEQAAFAAMLETVKRSDEAGSETAS